MSFKTFVLSVVLLAGYSLIHYRIDLARFFIVVQVVAVSLIFINLLNQSVRGVHEVYCRKYFTSLLIAAGCMLFMGLTHILLGIGNYTLSTIIQDFLAMIVLSSGLLLTKRGNPNDEYLVRYLMLVAALAVFSGLVALAYADFSLGRDANVWQPQYVWWGLLFPWSCLLLYVSITQCKSWFWKGVAYSTTGMYIVLGLLFEKRIVLVQVAIVLALAAFATKRRNSLRLIPKASLLITGLVVVVVVSSRYFFHVDVSALFEATWMRLQTQRFTDFDRLVEFTNLFLEYPYSVIFTGAGLGSYHRGPGGINIHIGWLNYIFKGGVMFAAVEVVVFGIALSTLIRAKDKWHKFIAASVVFNYLSMLIISSWVATPVTMHVSVMKFALLRIAGIESEKGDPSNA